MARSRKSSPFRHVGLGLELAGAVCLMSLIGYGIDRWQDTAPWGLFIMASLGIIGGLYNLIKEAIRANRDE